MLLAASVPGFVNAISLPTPTELAPMLARDAEPSSSPGIEARLSNSARFQRGLGPRRPRQLYNATRAILPRTSNSPSTPYLAEVAYVSEPDTVVGWLGAMLSAAGNEALFTVSWSTHNLHSIGAAERPYSTLVKPTCSMHRTMCLPRMRYSRRTLVSTRDSSPSPEPLQPARTSIPAVLAPAFPWIRSSSQLDHVHYHPDHDVRIPHLGPFGF